MSGSDSDGFGQFDLGEFTAEDFEQIDAHIAQCSHTNTIAEESFEFDRTNEVNLSLITEDEFLEIDRRITTISRRAGIAAPTSIIPEFNEAVAGPSTAAAIAVVPQPVKHVLQPESILKPQPNPQPTKPKSNSNWDPKKSWQHYASRSRQKNTNASLMDRFRTRGILSVSDLVGPTWCEVQYDYGLRQKRSRPLESRPKTFTSSSGKKMSVEKQVAEKNDHRTKQGQAVHKELEREIGLEELKVDVTTEAERWGLRLINIMASFQVLVSDGMTREMPVFGIVNDLIVTGIVDEIQQVPLRRKASKRSSTSASPNRDSPSKRTRRSGSGSPDVNGRQLPTDAAPFMQTTIDVASTKGKGRARSPSRRRILQVWDTKTRTVDWLPPDEDTYASRLQVMLYLRLLEGLLSIDVPFDFPAFWKKAGVDQSKAFSKRFIAQTGLLVHHNEGLPTTNLDGLVQSWQNLVESSGVIEIDHKLRLIYRRQPEGTVRKGKRVVRIHRAAQVLDREDHALAKAIEASLAESRMLEAAAGARGEGTSNGPDKRPPCPKNDDEEIDEELQKALYRSLLPQSKGSPPPGGKGSPSDPISVDDNEEADTSIYSFKTIGTKAFFFDGPMLQGHIDYILEFWQGKRKPQGVSESLVRRCGTCEYRNDCEWREEMAAKVGGESPVK
ncbi:hypothetical protein FA15DRAFT_262361 [Coprinopsis marcescibilis]|uniref:Exonuclease V n=1 Tax=Coprinopsis marcescibilis TaxID=230819 RepID=A0A5C3L0Y9_COPMA|nr:hypothetical protein FA15DRAFT_262361 [Coprinopsis marcescibilis]